MQYEELSAKIERFIEENKPYINFNPDHDEVIEAIEALAENDGRCPCTSGVGPVCPEQCKWPRKVIKGEADSCACGLFVG